MRRTLAVVVVTVGMSGLALGRLDPLAAQQAGHFNPSPTPTAAAAGDVKSVLFSWMWLTGMLRGYDETDLITTMDIWKSTGTIQVGQQPCRLMNYRASINYQDGGMRVQYTCTLPNGQSRHVIEVVSGQFAWDEDVPGAELVAGRGTATPTPAALNERLIRLWSGPQGAAKAAVAGGGNTKVAMEGGKPVVSFPIPGVQGALAKATLNAGNQAERVVVKQGNSVMEFVYEKYEDCNPADDRYDVLFPRHIIEKRDGVTILDLNVVETQSANIYVIMPVPERVRKAGAGR